MCIFNAGLITFRVCSLLLVQNADVESHKSRRLTCHSYSVIFVSLVNIHHYGSTCILRWCLILSVANIISHYQWCNKPHPKQNSPFTFLTLTVSWQLAKEEHWLPTQACMFQRFYFVEMFLTYAWYIWSFTDINSLLKEIIKLVNIYLKMLIGICRISYSCLFFFFV